MGPKVKTILKNLIFLSLGIGMMWWVSRGQKIEDYIEGFKSMNYGYFIVSAFFAVASHYFRALRWKLLINSVGYHPKTSNVFASVLFMYVSNLVIPRSGEVARCGTLYKYEKIPVPPLLGTVVVERVFDLVCLLILTGLLVFVQFDVISQIYYETQIDQTIAKLSSNKILILSILGVMLIGAIAVFKLRHQLYKIKVFAKVGVLLNQMLDSFKKILKLDKKLLFLLYTVFIWIGYIGMFYICFFAYEATSGLGLADGLAAFVAGSYGMVAPIQGGMGVWQLMVKHALVIIGVDENPAIIWANVAFILMTLYTALAGIIGFVSLPYINKSKEVEPES